MTNQEFFDKIIEYHKYCSGDPDLLEGRLGIEPLECDIEAQTADYIYNAVRWHRNDYLGVHGGTIAAVFDYTMALTLGGQGVGPIGTVNMSLQYLRPAMGDKFRVHTETMHLGNRILQAHAVMYDGETGKPIAEAQATYSKVGKTPVTFAQADTDK